MGGPRTKRRHSGPDAHIRRALKYGDYAYHYHDVYVDACLPWLNLFA